MTFQSERDEWRDEAASARFDMQSITVPAEFLESLIHDADERDSLKETRRMEVRATEQWQHRAQRAEEAVQALVDVQHGPPKARYEDMWHAAMSKAIAVINATPPPEGEPEKCPDGLLPDGETCPRCGGKRAPSGIGGGTWVHTDAPRPPEQAHGDALAALMEIVRAHVGSQDDAIAADQAEEEIRKQLTASGVPYVPEEVRRLPEQWRRNPPRNAQDCAYDLESVLASAPADGYKLVPVEPTREMQRAYFDVIDRNMSRVETDPIFGRHENHRAAYKAMIAAAPTDGRE